MMFSGLQGMTIPEGVVTQIAKDGVVLWAVKSDEPALPVILEVEKITSNTYAGETTYNNEEFILLDIYPKTNGTVNVTYGGLTKTITETNGAASPNAQQVFFGTFNGVSDSVPTPARGELTIEGDYIQFGLGSFATSSKNTGLLMVPHGGITNVIEWGNITEIASDAFHGCTALALTSLPNRITRIGGSAFQGCDNLALTSLPSGLTRIYSSTFYNCTALAVTSLPSGLTSIDYSAFYNCTALAVTSLPSGLTSIGEYAFQGCANLALTSLPSGLTSIEKYAFKGCDNLALTSLPNSITSIGEYAFNGCDNLALTSLPNSITSIGNYAFASCDNLALTSLPNSITSIGNYAFAESKSISIKEFPEGLISIGASAFYMGRDSKDNMLTSMTDVILPSTITSIGDRAFCVSLLDGASSYSSCIKSVTILATTPPTIGTHCFGSYGVPITVPNGCGETYKTAAGWSDFADKITEMV